jgi:hypothetical protein
LPAHWQAWAQDHARLMGSSLSQDQVLAMADQFRDYWHAKPGAGAVKLDWLGTWRNWVRTDMNRQPRPRMQPDQISVTSGI